MATKYAMDVPKDPRSYIPSSQWSNSTSFAAVTLKDGINYLFYYDRGNHLACLAGKDADSYNNRTVRLNGSTIQAGEKSPLAATAWEDRNGSPEAIRLYYIDTSSSQIKELVSENGGESWKEGAFNRQKYHIARSGGLAASSSPGGGLKVYFADPDNDDSIVEASIGTVSSDWELNVIQ
ncbi:hypothetical protein F5Y04DRAFT_279019 [Hypomontagnella monticulosa]|nr:hypothetical protein F5Y04DRAFT_279019 [Hypomontagnella monticulosa]